MGSLMQSMMNIPGYQIIKPIGAGGMAEVYLALQESLHRHVAIKVIQAMTPQDDTLFQRFLKEGKIVAGLAHPNIIKVFDTGVHADHLFLAMEYLEGGTLKDRLNQGMSLGHKLEITSILLNALGYAHQQGIIHRDIKPQNILFYKQGIPVLSDFGIAKALACNTTNLTASAVLVGSPRYMSPEQLRGEPIDHRADLYSMGVLFYELLLEEAIYSSVTDPFALALRHMSEPVPQLPAPIQAFQPVLDGLMARDRNERFTDTTSALAALDAASNDHGPISASDSTRIIVPHYSEDTSTRKDPQPPRWSTGKKITLAVLASIMIAGLTTGFIVMAPQSNPPRTLDTEPPLTPAHITLDAPGRFESPSDTSIPDETAQIIPPIPEVIDHAQLNPPLTPDAELPSTPEPERIILDVLSTPESPSDTSVSDETAQIIPPIPEVIDFHDQDDDAATRLAEYEQTIAVYHAQAMEELENENFIGSIALLDAVLVNWPEAEKLSVLRTQALQLQEEHRQQAQAALEIAEIESEETASTPPSESTELRQEISQRLQQAEQHLAANRLTVPARNNAFEEYRAVLNLEPDNPTALQGLDAIAERYVALVRRELNRNRYQQAQQFVDRGLMVSPGHSALRQLQQQITDSQPQPSPAHVESPQYPVDPCEIDRGSRACWCSTFGLRCD